MCSYGNQVETSLSCCGHTCTDLSIPIAGEVEHHGVNGRSRIFHIPKKLEKPNFDITKILKFSILKWNNTPCYG